MIIATRSPLTPVTFRRAAPTTLDEVSACTSMIMLRLPVLAVVSTLPDGTRYAEISDKVRLAKANAERDALMSYLAKAGVEVCADQAGQAPAKMKRLLAK